MGGGAGVRANYVLEKCRTMPTKEATSNQALPIFQSVKSGGSGLQTSSPDRALAAEVC